MLNTELRQLNAAYVLKHFCNGNKAEMARRIGKLQQSVSKWFTETDDHKNIGNGSARLIEQVFGLPHGWMDQPHENLNDLEMNPQRRTALRIASGETYSIPLRQSALVDQRLRLTLIDQLQGNLMLLSTDKDAYALQLHGHNPTLWLHDRWLVVIEPNTPLSNNECTLLTLNNGERLLRILVHDSPTQMAVRNPVTGEQEILLHDQIAKAEYAYIGIPPSKVALPDDDNA